ncbi:MAG: hypothetical protein JW918_06110 [Anaerolineae bacterium]|nr:hypothetical protein [Anaerolineae bacterium]
MPTKRSLCLIGILVCVTTMACTVGVARRDELMPAQPETPPAPSPFPALERRLSLAPERTWLHDLLLDRDTGRLYVTDTAGQLHVLDAKTYAELVVLQAGGELLLDAAHERLYASPRWFVYGDTITVVDTTSLAVTHVISGNAVALDTSRDRIYVGHSGVSVYDGATLEKLGEITLPGEFHQPGIPVYNPLRDEVYIVDDTVYRADAETWQVTGDLLPDVSAQTCPRCTGNIAAHRAYVYPERNLLVIDMFTRASSGGPGRVIGPRFFDATTLEPITDPAQTPAAVKGCEERFILNEPVDGRTYRGEKYARYTVYNNLMVYGPGGALETWRDGLAGGVTNPRTAQMYAPYNDGLLVLDLPALTPVGTLPAACVHSLDAESGTLYTFDGGDLVVFAEQGGTYDPPGGGVEPLPGTAVGLIALSPNYAADRTLFAGFWGESAYAPAKLYRSTDGGQTWTRLRGGLPESEYLALALAVSPGFAEDRTLFAGGYIYTGEGAGVYRSTDGGDTWEPLWNGLSHLRIEDIILSPGYPADGTLLAYAKYDRIVPAESGWSVHRSTDRGASWSPVMTTTEKAALPYPEDILPPKPMASQVRFRLGAEPQRVKRSTDGGQTWHAVSLNRVFGLTTTVEAVMPSPNLAADHTVYVLTRDTLFRSTDDGDTWQRSLDERLVGRGWLRGLTAAALTPPLADGRQQLFVGTGDGELLVLAPEEVAWAPVEIAPQWSTILEGERVDAIEAVPDGSIWMSVWGSGLARYAGGAIQARYTVADGLPGPYVSAITAAPDGSIWGGTETPAGVARFDGRAWTAYPLTEEQAGLTVWDVAVAPDGTAWIGTDKAGVMRWDGHTWERIADPADRIGYLTRDIEVGSDGTLWCATPGGLAFYMDGTWSIGWSSEVFAVELGPAGSATIVEGQENRTVRQYVDGEWRLLPPVKDPHGPALHIAADGAVWIGTLKGAFRYDGRDWRQFTARDGLPNDQVYAIAEDADGWLWFGTADGAARVDPATLNLTPVQR